jgi:hypothetical protein
MDQPDPRMNSLIFSLVRPEQVFRKNIVKGIVNEFLKRYGHHVLVDFLVAIDATDMLASVIVLDRGEVDEYVFQKYGFFDENMMIKVQMTERWEKFAHDVMEMSGEATQEAIEEVMRQEGL